MKKKLLSLLVLTALTLSVFSVNVVLTGSAEDSNVLYFNDFDTSYEEGEWTTASQNAFRVNRTVNSDTGNGVLQVSTTDGTATVELGKNIKNTAAEKPRLLFEYRFRFVQESGWNGYTSLGQKAVYDDQTRHCHIVFNNGANISNTVFDENGKQQIGTINGANTWNTISVLYDNIENKRTVYINGANGVEIETGNTWVTHNAFNVFFVAGIRSNVSLEFDYIRIATCPETFDYAASGSDGSSVDLTFNSLPDPAKMIPGNFTVDGAVISAVERNYEKPNTYSLEFETPLEANTYTVTANANVTSVDGTAVNTEAKSFTAVPAAPEYAINYLYNYDFTEPYSLELKDGKGKIEPITDKDGNDVLRMYGDTGDLPEIRKNAGQISGNPNVVLEFRYRTDGFSSMYSRVQQQVAGGTSPVCTLYNNEVRANIAATPEVVAPALNGKWHNVSVIYNGSKPERTVIVDDNPGVVLTGDYGTNGNEYGKGENSIFAIALRGYYNNDEYVDFDYLRAYTYPEFSMKLPKEEGVSTGSIDVDFSYFPDVSTLTNANISVKETGTENVVTTAGNPVYNGTVRQYTLTFDDVLAPNTTYDISLNVEDIDRRPLSITKTFTTGDPIMEIGELSIDKANLSAVTASFTAVNQTQTAENGVLMLAAYTVENGVEKMAAMSSKEVSIAAESGKATYTSNPIDVSALEGDVVIRAFLWSGESNMVPLTEMKEETK